MSQLSCVRVRVTRVCVTWKIGWVGEAFAHEDVNILGQIVGRPT